jgi:hypothetical protein
LTAPRFEVRERRAQGARVYSLFDTFTQEFVPEGDFAMWQTARRAARLANAAYEAELKA